MHVTSSPYEEERHLSWLRHPAGLCSAALPGRAQGGQQRAQRVAQRAQRAALAHGLHWARGVVCRGLQAADVA